MGRKAYPNQYDEPNRYHALIGGRCSVGEGVPAPHRVTIRLSQGQFDALLVAAADLNEPVATAARLLLLNGIGHAYLERDVKAHVAESAVAARASIGVLRKRKGRPVVSSSAA